MSNYKDNMYQWLKRNGYAPKYEHAGIYSVSIDNKLVYIGKSMNMLQRLAEHYVGIKTKSEHKYRIMAQAQERGHCINFDVLYYAKNRNRADIIEEIGAKEGEYIRKYMPPLNTQIPKKENWHSYTINSTVSNITVDEILRDISIN